MPDFKVDLSARSLIKAVLIVIMAWLSLQLIWKAREPIVWVLLAGFFAIGLYPVVRWVERYTWRRRALAITLLTLVGIGVFALLMLRVVPLLIEQTQHLAAFMPTIQQSLQHSDNPAAKLAEQYHLWDALQANRDRIVGFVVNSFSAIFFGSINFIGISITIYVLMVYFLMGGPHWVDLIKRTRYGEWWQRHEETLRAMAAAVSGYILGNFLTSVLAFAFAFVMLVTLGVGAPLPIAFIYGIFDIIPIVGATLGGILLVAIALTKSVTAAVIMTIAILIYQQVESSLLAPKVYGRALRLPNVVVMLAAIFGGVLAGLLGALLAIPLAACVRVAVLDYLRSRGQRSSGPAPPARS